MHKRHYEMIAKAIRETQEEITTAEAAATLDRVTEKLADAFKKDDGRFHKDKFINASVSGDSRA